MLVFGRYVFSVFKYSILQIFKFAVRLFSNCANFKLRELTIVERRVGSVFLEQLFVTALFRDIAVLHV